MERGTGHTPVLAEWALISKTHDDFGYRIVAASMGNPADLAYRWVARSPGSHLPADAPGAPPWVTFGAHETSAGPLVSVTVLHPWTDRDRVGRPIWPQSVFALSYADLAALGASYQTLWHAVSRVELPIPNDAPIVLAVEPQPLDGDNGLIAAVEAFGFERLAAIAAALLDGAVAVGGTADMKLDQRLQLLDAIAALLPYGYRADLSASTAVDIKIRHKMRLVLTDFPADNQQAIPLASPPQPRSALAREYLKKLLDTVEVSGTAALTRHLCEAKAPYTLSAPQASLEILEQLDRFKYLLKRIQSDRPELADVLGFLDGPRDEIWARWELERERDPGTLTKLLECLLESRDHRAAACLYRNWDVVLEDLAELVNRELNQGRLELAERSLGIAAAGGPELADALLGKMLVPVSTPPELWQDAIRSRVSLLLRIAVPSAGILLRTCDYLRFEEETGWQCQLIYALLSAEITDDRRGARALGWASWLCLSDFAKNQACPYWVTALGFAVTDAAETGSAASVRQLINKDPDWAVLLLQLARSSDRLRAVLEIPGFATDLIVLAVSVVAAGPARDAFRSEFADALSLPVRRPGLAAGTIACGDVARVVLGGPPCDFPYIESKAYSDEYFRSLGQAIKALPEEPKRAHIQAGFLEHVLGAEYLFLASVQLLELWIKDPVLAPALVQYIGTHNIARKLTGDPRLGPGFWRRLIQRSPQLMPGQAMPLEIKVVLLGEGTVGKTSLVSALKGDLFQDHELTHGIQVHSLVGDTSPGVLLHLWDFGGQETYRATQEFFLSPDALYLVVWNSRAGHKKDDVPGWLSRIRRRLGDTARVMLVATHAEEFEPDLDYPALEHAFPRMLVGHHAVDNKTGKGIAQLRSALTEHAVSLHLGRSLPDTWLEACDTILPGVLDRPHISYQEFAAACADSGMTDAEAEALARLLHETGRIIYHADDETLADLVILDPEWLSRAIGYVLTDSQTRTSGGILDHRRLADVWRPRPGEPQYPRSRYPYFLRLMEQFDISYRLEDGRHSLIAQLVPAQRPELPWGAQTPLPAGVRRLTLICALSEAVPGLIPALTVRLGSANANLHWREGVFLRHPNPAYASEALVELVADRELRIEVRAPSPDYFLHVLSDSFEHLARRWKGLSYRQLIPCPSHLTARCSGRFDLASLLAAQRRHAVTAECHVCFSRFELSALLSGFTTVFPSGQSGTGAPDLNQIAGQLREIAASVGRIDHGVRRIETGAAENADALRRLLIVAATEITDCPRLFTLVRAPHTGIEKLKVHRRQFRLTLWCEHPGSPHPCSEGVYLFEKDAAWLQQVSTYIRPVLLILKEIIPLAGTLSDMLLTKAQLEHASNELDLMQALVSELPVLPERSLDDFSADIARNPAAALGADLRGVRQLLTEIDSYGKYGGLRRMLATSGEYLWICPQHAETYEPRLPDM